MGSEIEKRYIFAQNLILQAGETALSFYLNRQTLDIECKQGNRQDEVSIADKTVEFEIKQALQQHFPQDGFLGEESGGG